MVATLTHSTGVLIRFMLQQLAHLMMANYLISQCGCGLKRCDVTMMLLHALKHPCSHHTLEAVSAHNCKHNYRYLNIVWLQEGPSATEKAKETAESLKGKTQQATEKTKEGLKTAAGERLPQYELASS